MEEHEECFRLDTEATSGGVKRTRSLPQGDPAAPMLFNLTLDTLATRFAAICFRNKWGEVASRRHVGEHHLVRRQLLAGGNER